MDKPKGQRRKRKPSKEQRDKARGEKATAFNDAFSMGHDVGYKNGYERAIRDVAEKIKALPGVKA